MLKSSAALSRTAWKEGKNRGFFVVLGIALSSCEPWGYSRPAERQPGFTFHKGVFCCHYLMV